MALRLKEAMIADLRLEDVSSDAISADTRLFDKEEGLGLDSLDAVELVTTVEKEFGVSIPNADEAQRAFGTFGSLVAYIADHMA
ncbi:MAG: acyl carrier protein [Desulfovibrio sp.]|nr:acyl carrier protein [Desulfovibrio sp.]